MAGWDYTPLAANYDLRVDYSESLVDDVLRSLQLCPGEPVVDVGAGTGKLTVLLRRFGLEVTAIEPSDAMRAIALGKRELEGVSWIAARAEALPIDSQSMRLVSFGSSFNVIEAPRALDECARVLRPGGYWLALWNHRDLDDRLQCQVEALLHRHLPAFDYGARRASPAAQVEAHGAFENVVGHERRFVVRLRADDWLRAWQSHATLKRQAGDRLDAILDEIAALVNGSGEFLDIPYFTRGWTARRR